MTTKAISKQKEEFIKILIGHGKSNLEIIAEVKRQFRIDGGVSPNKITKIRRLILTDERRFYSTILIALERQIIENENILEIRKDALGIKKYGTELKNYKFALKYVKNKLRYL